MIITIVFVWALQLYLYIYPNCIFLNATRVTWFLWLGETVNKTLVAELWAFSWLTNAQHTSDISWTKDDDDDEDDDDDDEDAVDIKVS